jgi:hypothetical protein
VKAFGGTRHQYLYLTCPVCGADEAVEVVVRASCGNPTRSGLAFEEEILETCCELTAEQEAALERTAYERTIDA